MTGRRIAAAVTATLALAAAALGAGCSDSGSEAGDTLTIASPGSPPSLDPAVGDRWLALEGVPVELHDYSGHIHGFFHMLGVTQAAQDAVRRSAAALREGLGRLQHPRRAWIA